MTPRTENLPAETDAAYLFLDKQIYKACYSVAGHPPLLLSHRGSIKMHREQRGVTIQPDYPVRYISAVDPARMLDHVQNEIDQP